MKKYLSSLLWISLLLMVAGCGKETALPDTPSDGVLAEYDEYLNQDHNIVWVRNLLEKAHNEIDDEEVDQLYADFKSGSLNDGEYTWWLGDCDGSSQDYFRGYRNRYVGYIAQTMVKYPSVRTIENVFGEGYPTLFKHNENGLITDLYIIDHTGDSAEDELFHLSLDQEGHYLFDEGRGKVILKEKLIDKIVYDDIEYQYTYDESGRIINVSSQYMNIKDYHYGTDGSQEYPDLIESYYPRGIKEYYDEEGRLIHLDQSTEGIYYQTWTFTYDESGRFKTAQIIEGCPDKKREISNYTYTYNDEGLLTMMLVCDEEGHPLERHTIEQGKGKDSYKTRITIDNGVNDKVLCEIIDLFDGIHTLESHKTGTGEE